MRQVPVEMTAAWKAEDKTGSRRPVVRATIQKTHLRQVPYDTALAPGGDFTTDRHRTGKFTTIIFGDNGVIELRNIKSINWTRSVNADVAECTLTIQNTDLIPMGSLPEIAHPDDFDQPGIMSPTRGANPFGTVNPNPWGYDVSTGWNGLLVPDRLVRTYEGYGVDQSVPPAQDANLLQSGTWLIDEVMLNNQGDIEVKMRDVGRLLLDQIVFPPVVPYAEYPLKFSKIRTENVDGRDVTGGSWVELTKKMGKATSSNSAYIGKGLTDPPYDAYVTKNGGVNGHHPNHVLENKDGAYWWSTGQTTLGSKVWWQIDLDEPTALNGVRLQPKGGPYRIYISLKNANGWIGRRRIPYDVTTEGIDVDADVPFVYSTMADRGLKFDAILKKKYGAITAIRITFTRLTDTEIGKYPFRAGLKDIWIYTGAKVDLGFKKGKFLKTVGNYRDFTDIVKWCCAWGGFFWPPHATGLDYINIGGGVRQTITYASPDPVLPKGRVWGDFMNSGTAAEPPRGDIGTEQFDKQPLMSIISYVRDLLGFIFFIDETGGVVWRLPNLGLTGTDKLGNYLSPSQLGVRSRARTTEIVTIDETETLLQYSTRLNGRSQRERIFVADTTGKIGTVIKGYVPYPSGFRRTAGWTDQGFETKRECTVMADMVAARQMFDYRRSQIRIAGYPAIQIDDQIRVFERVTNETFYQYVESIACQLDMDTGQYTYDLETHWLGEDPTDAWAVTPEKLNDVTKAYLNAIGA